MRTIEAITAMEPQEKIRSKATSKNPHVSYTTLGFVNREEQNLYSSYWSVISIASEMAETK